MWEELGKGRRAGRQTDRREMDGTRLMSCRERAGNENCLSANISTHPYRSEKRCRKRVRFWSLIIISTLLPSSGFWGLAVFFAVSVAIQCCSGFIHLVIWSALFLYPSPFPELFALYAESEGGVKREGGRWRKARRKRDELPSPVKSSQPTNPRRDEMG